MLRRLDFRLRQPRPRARACHGVISAGISVPESLVGPSWRLRRLHFPTTPATAPCAFLIFINSVFLSMLVNEFKFAYLTRFSVLHGLLLLLSHIPSAHGSVS